MTASLLALVSIALLVLVSGFCFVGCVLNTHGLGGEPSPTPFNKYSDTDVIGNKDCVAYWPLSEPSAVAGNSVASAIAVDVVGTKLGSPHNGNYTHKGNAPQLFPCPAFQLAPGVDTAAAIGFLSLGDQSIVKGDAKQPPTNPLVLTTGMQVNGGFVTVPANSVTNPSGSFTIEAWARPEWADTDAGVYHSLIDSRDNNAMGVHGFAIWVNEDGNWEAVLNCTNGKSVVVTAGSAVLKKATHVVLVLNGNNASLFIDGALASAVAPLPAGETFSANTTTPLVIGVGLPFLPPRTQPSDNNFFPLMPFNGTIQDVAIYKIALDPAVINTHNQDGSGNGPPEPAD
jgi:hypothetical protein